MKSAKCLACGFVGSSELGYCKACRAPFNVYATNPGLAGSAYDLRHPVEGQSKGLAIVSLVLGIISFLTLGLLGVGAILGIILAAIAMSRVKREPWKYGGRGIAIAGLVLSITSLAALAPAAIIAALAIPNLLAARVAANEGSAIYSLRTIGNSEMTYQAQFDKYATLEELENAGLIDAKLASGVKSGYLFTVNLVSDPDGPAFNATAVPVDYRHSGRRSFYVDNTLVIRAADHQGVPASALDAPLGESMPSLAPERRVGSGF